MKLCDLTVEQYLGITQAWGTGVWLLTTAAVVAGAWLWKRRRARKLPAIAVEVPDDPPAFERCPEPECMFLAHSSELKHRRYVEW